MTFYESLGCFRPKQKMSMGCAKLYRLKELLLVNEKQRPFSRRKISFQTLFPLFLLPLQQCLYKHELRLFGLLSFLIIFPSHFGLFGAWVKQVQTETSYILLSMIQLGMYPNVNIIIPPTIST